MKRIMFAWAILLISYSQCFAADPPSLLYDGGTNSLIATIDTFTIKLSNQAEKECLPYPQNLKDKMEIGLRRNGFKISPEDDMSSDYIHIEVLGNAVDDYSCAVYIQAGFLFKIHATVPYAYNQPGGDKTYSVYYYKIGHSLITGSKINMQEKLEKKVIGYADDLYLNISRAKEDIFKKFPSIKHTYTKIKNINSETSSKDKQ